LLQLVTVTTQNWATMPQLAFGFSLSPRIALYGCLFALAMGLLGGFFPAWRASRVNVVAALAERVR
jgi:ABC-type antimicrobial peptide transport system permease subunit